MRRKILFITAFTPSNNGAAVKNTKIMLKDLSTSYDVDLVYFKYKSDNEYLPDNENIHVLKASQISTLKKILFFLNFPFLHPFFLVRFNWILYTFLNKSISLNNYKGIVFDHSQVMLYARLLRTNVPKFLISHDVISQRVSRSSNRFMAEIAIKSERYVLSAKNAKILSFSLKDCNLITSLYHRKAELCLDYIDEMAEKAIPYKIENYFVFFAYWGRRDNYEGLNWFYINVVPLIKEKTEIIIIGKGLNPEYVQNENPFVTTTIKGFVDNPYDIIANAKAVISPLFSGAGIKVKVIESLACGTPVLGTEIAFEGFDSKYDSFMYLCNTPQEYIDRMKDINCDVERRNTFKSMFLNTYKSKTIMNYIEEIK